MNSIQQQEKEIIVTSKNEIIASIVYWGIRQSPYTFPKNLEAAIVAMQKRIDEKGLFKSTDKKETGSYLQVTPKELFDLVHDIVFNTPEVAIWNVTQVEQDNGVTDPNDPARKVKYAMVGHHVAPIPEDKDFIDLDALVRNSYNML